MSAAPPVGNIGPLGIRRRALSGWMAALVAALGLLACLVYDVDRAWRLALCVPLGMAALGLVQAREGT